ncbi:8565_t:CDS:2, partial [Dentiscutata erythropus]
KMFSNQTVSDVIFSIRPFIQFILFGLYPLRYKQLQSKSKESYKITTHDDLIYTEIKEEYYSIPVSIYVFYKKTFESKTISKKIKQLPFLQEKDKIIFIFYLQNNSYYYYDIDDDKTEKEEFETKLINKYKDKEKSISVKTSSGRKINLLNTLVISSGDSDFDIEKIEDLKPKLKK